MKRKIFFFLLIGQLIFFTKSFAQNTDSLWSVYRNTENFDSVRLDAFNTIAWNLLYTNPDSAYSLGHEELDIARRKKLKRSEAEALNTIGASYQVKNNYLKAIEFYQQSLKLREELGDKKGISSSLANIGSIYINIELFEKALEYQQRSLKIFEEMNNKEGMASAYNNMGVIYNNLSAYYKALVYDQKSLKLYQDLGNKQGIRSANDNIGNVYANLLDYSKALVYQMKGLELAREIGDKQGSAILMSSIGKSYMKQKKYDLALDYLDKANKISLELEDIYSEKEITSVLYETYKAMGNKDKALKNYERYIELRDSISKEDRQKEINNKELQYEYEKKFEGDSTINEEGQRMKDALIAVKNAELEQNKTQKRALYGGLLSLFVFGGVMYNRFRITRKQKEIIEIKNQETEEQKGIIEEKQKEILASISYAKRLQEAILPPQSLMKKFLPESFFFYKPKDIVAGDFYWFETFNPTKIGSGRNNINPNSNSSDSELILFAAADCTGHGVPGAMVSVVCSNALNRTLKEFGITEPGKILDKVRELVIETFEKSESEVKDGMDISLCCLNKETKELQWSGANNPLWIIRNNEFMGFKPNKQPIGKVDNPRPFTTHTISLQTNDIIYIFTDGFADQFGGVKDKKYKLANLKQLFLSHSDLSMQKQLEFLEQELLEWEGDKAQVDDILIIGIRI